MSQDIVGFVIDLLAADTDVAAIVGLRIYGGEHPASQAASGETPSEVQQSVVVRLAPSAAGLNNLQVEASNLDILCFGESPRRANIVRMAVHQALKDAPRQRIGSVFVHYFDQVGGAQSMRDPDTQWPFTVETWRFMASECPAT